LAKSLVITIFSSSAIFFSSERTRLSSKTTLWASSCRRACHLALFFSSFFSTTLFALPPSPKPLPTSSSHQFSTSTKRSWLASSPYHSPSLSHQTCPYFFLSLGVTLVIHCEKACFFVVLHCPSTSTSH
jgi:hypothetical protein